MDPDLHGTLRAIDPVYDPLRRVEECIFRWELGPYFPFAARSHLGKIFGHFPREIYNQDIFKKPTVYPPDPSAPRWQRSHLIRWKLASTIVAKSS